MPANAGDALMATIEMPAITSAIVAGNVNATERRRTALESKFLMALNFHGPETLLRAIDAKP